MSNNIVRLTKLLVGLFLYAVGIVVTINSNIGYSPWDVFHSGLSASLGISIGQATIIVGTLIVVIVAFFKEKIGIGTILNMLLIGLFMDFIMFLSVIPINRHFIFGFFEMILGLFIISFATFLYISSGFGAGPRDSLMVLLTKNIKLPVGVIRAGIELSVVAIGWILGGKAGIGTIIASIAIGFCIQITFYYLKFDPTEIRHTELIKTFSQNRE